MKTTKPLLSLHSKDKGLIFLDIHEMERAIEAILFASGDPVSIDRISAVLEVDAELVEKIANSLSDYYSYEQRGIRLLRLENTLQLCSSPAYSELVRKALETRKPPALSPALLEVLSVIAYRQPVTRAYIEQIRGVDCSYSISVLCEKELIEESGRLDVPGRPILYRTTKNFLRTFGLSSLNELPELPEFAEEGEQLTFAESGLPREENKESEKNPEDNIGENTEENIEDNTEEIIGEDMGEKVQS